MTVRQVTEQMNSDMFDRIERGNYKVDHFSKLELDQAKESFTYNGYKCFDSDGALSVKLIS